MTNDLNSPVAILDKELARYPSYRDRKHLKLCDCCGGPVLELATIRSARNTRHPQKSRPNLPNKLREMLAEGHSPRSQA